MTSDWHAIEFERGHETKWGLLNADLVDHLIILAILKLWIETKLLLFFTCPGHNILQLMHPCHNFLHVC